MTDTAVATQTTSTAVVAAEDLETLRAAVGPDLNNSQLKLALLYAQKVGADLFARQIYPIVMDGRLTFITSIDFLRVIAQRSGEYKGQGTVLYGEDCDCEGEEVKLLGRRHPLWAEVPIYREGFVEPIARRAYFHEYAPLERPKEGTGWIIKHTWRKMPHVLVAKVSEALGIRVAFPNDASQLYVSEEMEQASDGGPAGRFDAGDIAPEPDPPFESKFKGATKADSKGEFHQELREVQVPDWWKGPKPAGKTLAKIEVPFQAGRGKHTAMVMGALADEVEALKLEEGEVVIVDGTYYEYEWAKGKPKAKQLRNVKRLAVLRDNVWHEAGVLEGDSTEVAVPAATEVGPTPAAEPSDSASAPSDSAGPSTPEAEAATPAESSAPDLTQEAAAIFDGMFDDADVDPIRGGSAEIPFDAAPGMALDVWGEPEGTDTDMSATILAIDRIPTGKREVAGLWFKHPEFPVRFLAMMVADEAEAQGVFDRGPGEIVRVVGGWKRNTVTQADILMLTAVADPA